MPCNSRKELKQKRVRRAKLAHLRVQYSEGKKSKQDVLAKVALISPGLSWKEFEEPMKKKAKS